MKNLKIRLKRMIFGFFQDEILKFVEIRGVRVTRVEHEQFNVIELKSQITLDINTFGKPSTTEYEESLMLAKKELFRNCLKYIRVDPISVLDINQYRKRSIELSLFIATKK